MFSEPVTWRKSANLEAVPAAPATAGSAFSTAYQAALAQIAASKTWLESENQNQDEDEGGLSFPLGFSSLSSQSPASQPVLRCDNQLSAASGVDKNQLANWMDAHALMRSSHRCAMYCREGMEAAGLSTSDRPVSGDAADYGPFLLRHGAEVVSPVGYVPHVGDTVVFDKTEQHPNGHIEIYDGRQWVSDFLQRSFSPYRDAVSTPPFTIYRLA